MDGPVILLAGLLILAVYVAIDSRKKLQKLRGDAGKVESMLVATANDAVRKVNAAYAMLDDFKAATGGIVAAQPELTKAAIVISGNASAGKGLAERMDLLIAHREVLDRQFTDLHALLLEMQAERESGGTTEETMRSLMK